jgi:hypothetical protein
MIAVFTYMTWIHTERIGKLGWFDKIFSSPSNHRVHHGVNIQYHDKNYGGILIIWDKLFGSYEPEVEKVRYGITHQVKSSDPLKITMHEVIRLWRDLCAAKSWSDRVKHCLFHPGWQPDQNKGNPNPEALKD